MRSLHKMYKIILTDFEKRDKRIGICSSILIPQLSKKEQDKLMMHFNDNKPSLIIHSEFYKHRSFTGSLYWWNVNYPEATTQRYLFIQKMIEITKPIPLKQRIIKFFKSWVKRK